MRRRYTAVDDEPHGTIALIRYLIEDVPDTPRRLYGRRMVRRISAGCPRCQIIDQGRGRLRRIHTAYRP